MTKEEIAELWRRVDLGLKLAEDETGATGSERSVRRGLMRETPLAIHRLLEEREKLLHALTILRPFILVARQEIHDTVEEALRFATGSR